jgi:streptogramin lyase
MSTARRLSRAAHAAGGADGAAAKARGPRGSFIATVVLGCIACVAVYGCGARCVDADKDGRGEGCERGPDCDDHDPKRAAHCEEVPAGCEDNPTLAGCPCFADLDDVCYAGAPETLGVGMCRSGHAQCAHGVFLECEGSVLPRAERCNQLDDDCDGVIDEFVASPCGGCDDRCVGAVWGPPVAPFEAATGLALTSAGELTLQPQMPPERRFVWVPNTDEGTLSKLDADRAVEVARYRTPGNRPVRVAVDHRGDAWVLDRPPSERARLSKFAWEEERCIDVAGDGLQTSHAPDQVLARDDCRLLDIEVGEPGDDAQALAVDGAQAPDAELAGNAWVGLAAAQRVLSFDGQTGQQLTAAELPGFSAYAGSFDSWGRMWLIDRDGQLARVDPVRSPPAVDVYRAQLACYSLEGLCVEPGGRLLFAGFGCENVASFDPANRLWSDVRVPDLLSPRGIARAAQAYWVVYTSGQLARLDADSLALGQARELASAGVVPYESVAVAADSGERLWVVSTQGGPDGRGLATRYDPAAGEVTAQVPVGVGPRGGGDMTGVGLGLEFVRDATISHVFEGGCNNVGDGQSNGTRWKALHLIAEVGVGGSIDVAVRWAEEREGLAAVSFEELGSFPEHAAAFPLSLPEGGVIELRLVLRTSYATGAPRLARAGAEWTCAGPD